LTPKMRHNLVERLRMVYVGADGKEIFMSHAWRRLFEIRAPLVCKFILEFFSNCRQFMLALGFHTTEEMEKDRFEAYWLGSNRVILDKGNISEYWIEISSDKDFLRATEKVIATIVFYLHSMDRGATNVLYLLAQYLFRHAEGRKSDAMFLGGHFIGCLAHHFGLVSDDGLSGLFVVTRELPLINMVASAAALGDAEDASDVDEGAQAVPAPMHARPLPPTATGKTMYQRLRRLENEIQGLRQDVRSLRELVERSMTDQGRFSTWMISSMMQLIEASGRTYQAFDGTFQGSYPMVFKRSTK
nr:hypothetical protein [Tanacetum cinerariifolium]